MNILVTGAQGYIGNKICKNLRSKHYLHELSRETCDLSNSRVVNNFFDKNEFDVVIHCAIKGSSRLSERNYKTTDTNLQMYYNLLSNNHKYKKFINLGSGAEFSENPDAYGISKKVISNSIKNIENFYDLKIYGLFDEDELESRFIKASITNYINKTPILIHNNKKMDFFYIKDFFIILEYFIENQILPKSINCVYANKKSLFDIALSINKLGTYEVPIIIENDNANDYIGVYESFLSKFNFFGLDKGIYATYKNLLKSIK